ncbi:hypothetical protein ACOMHN_057057 [Nucella lapillus]
MEPASIQTIGNLTDESYTLRIVSAISLEEILTNQNKATFNPDPVSKETVDLVTDVLSCHVIPLIGLCGFVGNLFNIVVFLMQKRSQPMNSLLVTLAFVDAVYLVIINVEFVACSLRRYDPLAARNFTIMTFPHVIWFNVALSRISSMITVVIAVERCLVVMMPLKVKVFVTPFTIRVTAALACVIPALAHIPLFLRGEIKWVFNARLNTTLPYLKLTEFAVNNSHFMNLYKNLVLNVLFRYVIMGVISVCTVLTISQLKRYSRWRLSSVTGQGERAIISERDARASVTMMRVCVLFMVCSVPGCIMLTVRLIQPQFDFYGVYRQSFDLSREISNFFLVINSSCNFIIYMRGGDDFRKTFCKICQKVFPSGCINFLFRCVMCTDQDVSKTESHDSRLDNGGSKKNGQKRGTRGNSFASASTSVSRVFSAVTAQNVA